MLSISASPPCWVVYTVFSQTYRETFMRTRFFVQIIGLMMIVAAVSAQQRMMSVEDQVKGLTKQLTLTDEQVPKVTTILKEQRKKIEKMRETMERGPAMMEAFVKLSEETNMKMNKVLDEDQQKIYAKLMEERRATRGRRRSG